MNTTLIRERAKMINHALLHPLLTDAELKDGCVECVSYPKPTIKNCKPFN